MSWELMLDARHWDVSPTARHVGMVIASHANKWGRAWPSVETIAAETGRDRRTVMRAIRELAKGEHVRVVERTGRSNEYEFASYPQPPSTSGGGSHPQPPSTSGRGVTSDPPHWCPPPPSTSAPTPPTGAPQKNKEELIKEKSLPELSTDELDPSPECGFCGVVHDDGDCPPVAEIKARVAAVRSGLRRMF
jgi:Helix-turn-helix domain